MKFLCSLIALIARFCLAAVFLFSGISKLLFFDQTAQYMAAKSLPSIPLLLVGAAIVEIIGALCLIFGYKTRFGAAILLLFLIPTTLLFHNFWNLDGADRVLQQIMFLKNLAIFGGLLYVLNYGAGGCACDAGTCKSRSIPPEQKI